MNPEHLHYLCCPKTGQSLKLIENEVKEKHVVTGNLITYDGRYSYPIIRGIPRFVEREFYSNSFGYEWTKFPRIQYEDQNIGKPMEGQTTEMFHAITGLNPEEMKGNAIIEFGCGPGRFLDIVRRNGAIAIGIDLSIAVESAYKNLCNDSNVLIVQGDIYYPPFKKGIFDAGYCIGVLHHTPNPKRGVISLFSLIKKGGLIAILVYSKDGLYAAKSTFLTRTLMVRIRKMIGEVRGYKIAMIYSIISANFFYPITCLILQKSKIGKAFAHLIRKFFLVVVCIPDVNWRILDTFDAITPEYASTHTSEEVKGWLTDAGCNCLTQSVWDNTAWRGKKR